MINIYVAADNLMGPINIYTYTLIQPLHPPHSIAPLGPMDLLISLYWTY